jgi:hypothetical protein
MFSPDAKFPQPTDADDFGNFEEEKKHELEIQNKLIAAGKQYGNDFKFVEPALKLKKSELPDKINPKIFTGEIDPNYLKSLEAGFKDLKNFIAAPLIKDSFTDNHPARREWENKHLNLLSLETHECYNSNRFRFSNALQIVSFLEILRLVEQDSRGKINPEILSSLENVAVKIPELINGNSREYNSQYINLSDEAKIKALEDLASVVGKFVKILGEPKTTIQKEKALELEEELV